MSASININSVHDPPKYTVTPIPSPDTTDNTTDEVKTLFYIDFTPGVADLVHDELVKLKEDMAYFRAWVTNQIQGQVDGQRAKGKIPKVMGVEDRIAVESYRARAQEAILRRPIGCLAQTISFNRSNSFIVNSSDLHLNILTLAMEGFPIPKSIYKSLEAVLQSIITTIKATKQSKTPVEYSILATVYQYDHVARTLDPKLRMLRFSTDAKAYDVVTKKKQKHQEADIKIDFSVVEWDFLKSRWAKIYQSIEARELQNAMAIVNDNTFEVAF